MLLIWCANAWHDAKQQRKTAFQLSSHFISIAFVMNATEIDQPFECGCGFTK